MTTSVTNKIKIDKFYPPLNYTLSQKDVWRGGVKAPCILILSTTLRCVISFKIRPLYSEEIFLSAYDPAVFGKLLIGWTISDVAVMYTA
jgi:hypothetical protein